MVMEDTDYGAKTSKYHMSSRFKSPFENDVLYVAMGKKMQQLLNILRYRLVEMNFRT